MVELIEFLQLKERKYTAAVLEQQPVSGTTIDPDQEKALKLLEEKSAKTHEHLKALWQRVEELRTAIQSAQQFQIEFEQRQQEQNQKKPAAPLLPPPPDPEIPPPLPT